MRSSIGDTVSVIVPAFNAEGTISKTLASICRQSHRELDIIVVDDGSRDDTLSVVNDYCHRDSRIRILEQRNSGVAAARNAGIVAAQGDIIAPIDADDLWRPDKIERQLRALRAGGDEVGLVYSWSAMIDADDRILNGGDHPCYSGDVLSRLSFANFVGNGSTALMRKRLVQDHGGYDASLRARRAQGCEDWKLFIGMAEVSHFAVVQDHLTGYRQTPTAMSGDVLQMLRSDKLVRDALLDSHPEHQLLVEAGRHEYVAWLIRREADAGHWANLRLLLPEFTRGAKSLPGRARRSTRLAARAALNQLRPRQPAPSARFAFLPAATAQLAELA